VHNDPLFLVLLQSVTYHGSVISNLWHFFVLDDLAILLQYLSR
jgi:hypothetical protein